MVTSPWIPSSFSTMDWSKLDPVSSNSCNKGHFSKICFLSVSPQDINKHVKTSVNISGSVHYMAPESGLLVSIK